MWWDVISPVSHQLDNLDNISIHPMIYFLLVLFLLVSTEDTSVQEVSYRYQCSLDSNLVLWMFLPLPLSSPRFTERGEWECLLQCHFQLFTYPPPCHLFIVPLAHPYTCLSCHWRGLRSESGLFKLSSSTSFDLLWNKRRLIQLNQNIIQLLQQECSWQYPLCCTLPKWSTWKIHVTSGLLCSEWHELLTVAHVTDSLLTRHQSS